MCEKICNTPKKMFVYPFNIVLCKKCNINGLKKHFENEKTTLNTREKLHTAIITYLRNRSKYSRTYDNISHMKHMAKQHKQRAQIQSQSRCTR
jgi:uncharacterized protein (DUF2225 family)